MSSKVLGKKRAQPTESDDEAELGGDHQVSVDDDAPESGAKDNVGSSSATKTKTTSKPKSKSKKRKEAPSAGIVYISRLPPGMTPQKVKHLMARWGEVGKIYAQKKDGKLSLPLPTTTLLIYESRVLYILGESADCT